MDETTTIILAGLAVVVLLAGVYLVTRPPPSQDVSWEQVAQLAAVVATYW